MNLFLNSEHVHCIIHTKKYKEEIYALHEYTFQLL